MVAGRNPATPDAIDPWNVHVQCNPALQYFNELPFRLLSVDFHVYGGEREHRGRIYELVVATWGSLEPNSQHDQYLVWIDAETKRIVMCRYTMRDFGPAYAGTIHYEDYRSIQGVLVPFRQTVVIPAPQHTLYPLDRYFFHQERLESASFDRVNRAELIVDPSRPIADVKP